MTDPKENAYRALFEQASDCILVTDFSGNLIDANAAVVSTFGYSKEELMQMHISALIEAEDLRTNPIRFQLLDQGAQIFNERRMILKNGTVIEVEANVKKFNPSSIMAIVRDVTERNKARANLQRTYERLNYHLNNTPLAVIEEDKDLFITYWNRQAEEIFGWRAEEVIGKRIIDFMVYADDRSGVNELIENLGKGIPHKQPHENRNLAKSGEVLHCQWYNSLLLDADGNVETILSIIRDITDVREKEDKIQQYLLLLKDLSFVTSHELRSEYAKVQSVLNYLESVQEEGRALNATDQSFLLREATQSFHHINDVIGKLNAKIASGHDLMDC